MPPLPEIVDCNQKLIILSICMQWKYLLPVGLILVNAITQFANLPEELAPGQAAPGAPQRVTGPGAGGPRRR
jgi:hypothetical protein